MIQYGLNIEHFVRGYFTLEKNVQNKSLSEIEDILGYHKGRLKQGADFYIVSPPTRISDFDIMGTSIFPGHRFENSNLQKAINNDGKKKEHLSLFRRKRLIKIVPLKLHLEALKPFLKSSEYYLIKDLESSGLGMAELVQSIKRRFTNNQRLVADIEKNIQLRDDIYKQIRENGTDDYLYPSAKTGGILQWKVARNVSLPARCVCRLTSYQKDRYTNTLF